MKTNLIIVLAIVLFQSCKTQQIPTKSYSPKVANNLNGELDYTDEALELIQWQKNGDEFTLGTIDKQGGIHFNLPEFDIKALYGNMGNAFFQGQFQMYNCTNKGPVDFLGQPTSPTPYDDVYSQLYAPIHVKKYGEIVASLYPIADEKMLIKKNYNKVVGSNYYWFYIDRAIEYKDQCVQSSSNGPDLEINISADIQFEKGWNFVKRNIFSVQNYGENNEKSMPKEIVFTTVSPKDNEIKWFLEQTMDDEKIQAAKIIYNSATPITKEQFEKWLPNKVGDFTRTSYEFGSNLSRFDTDNNALLVFENGDQKIEMTFVDGAQSPNDLKTASLAYVRGEEKVDNGARYASILNESEKSIRIMSLFKERMFLDAVGSNMTEEQLWAAIETMKVGELVK